MSGPAPAGEDVGSLRLPVPFFDLFLVLLVCFMLFLAPLPDPGVEARDIRLPFASGSAKAEHGKVLAAFPHRVGNAWQFEPAGGGRRLTASELAAEAKVGGRKLVLVLAADTPLQTYMDLHAGLGAAGVEYGIAVRAGDPK